MLLAVRCLAPTLLIFVFGLILASGSGCGAGRALPPAPAGQGKGGGGGTVSITTGGGTGGGVTATGGAATGGAAAGGAAGGIGEASKPGSAAGSAGTASGAWATTDGGDASVPNCVGAPQGTVCSPGSCAEGAVVGRYLCDGRGSCVPGPSIVCAPFACDAEAGKCFSSCIRDTDCVVGRACVNGSCDLRVRAAACAQNAECASGFCVDGVCCDSACTGSCRACNIPQREGTCMPAPAGALDPRGACLDDGVATCGRNGLCDGVGGCANYPAGVTCAGTACRDGTHTTFARCNGVGTCVRTTTSCAPFACDTQTSLCHTDCRTDLDCAAGATCAAGSCGARSSTACTVDAECLSAHCAQGVCCESACDGVCQSCALLGTIGTCTPLPGAEPAGGCATSQP